MTQAVTVNAKHDVGPQSKTELPVRQHAFEGGRKADSP